MLSTRRPGASALMPLLVVALLVLSVFSIVRWRTAESRLKALSVQLEQLQGNPQQNQEKAKEIVAMVRKLIDIPADVEPTVAAIVDVEKLREQNKFYDKAQNGFYLIVTAERAILFDPNAQLIVDVVPVQIEDNAAAGAVAGSAASVAAGN